MRHGWWSEISGAELFAETSTSGVWALRWRKTGVNSYPVLNRAETLVERFATRRTSVGELCAILPPLVSERIDFIELCAEYRALKVPGAQLSLSNSTISCLFCMFLRWLTDSRSNCVDYHRYILSVAELFIQTPAFRTCTHFLP